MSTPEADNELRMTIIEHLLELRDRLVKASIALVVGIFVGVFFARRFLELLLLPLGQAGKVQSLRPAENILVFFRVALILGAVLAMPVIFYQLMAFIAPGLTKEEKRALMYVVPAATLLFALGVGFGAFVMLPFTLGYLQAFLADLIEPNYSIDYYIGFVTNFTLAIGAAFETPVAIGFLARLGFLSPQTLLKAWRYAIVIVAILAAIITPTPDPFNMMLVMTPLLLLYGVSIGVARVVYRPRPDFSASEETTTTSVPQRA